MGYVLGTIQPPAVTIKKDDQQVSNPDYEFWDCQDQLIIVGIIASTNFSIMNTAADAKIPAEARNKIQIAFANKFTSRILSLRDKLLRTKRDSHPTLVTVTHIHKGNNNKYIQQHKQFGMSPNHLNSFHNSASHDSLTSFKSQNSLRQ